MGTLRSLTTTTRPRRWGALLLVALFFLAGTVKGMDGADEPLSIDLNNSPCGFKCIWADCWENGGSLNAYYRNGPGEDCTQNIRIANCFGPDLREHKSLGVLFGVTYYNFADLAERGKLPFVTTSKEKITTKNIFTVEAAKNAIMDVPYLESPMSKPDNKNLEKAYKHPALFHMFKQGLCQYIDSLQVTHIIVVGGSGFVPLDATESRKPNWTDPFVADGKTGCIDMGSGKASGYDKLGKKCKVANVTDADDNVDYGDDAASALETLVMAMINGKDDYKVFIRATGEWRQNQQQFNRVKEKLNGKLGANSKKVDMKILSGNAEAMNAAISIVQCIHAVWKAYGNEHDILASGIFPSETGKGSTQASQWIRDDYPEGQKINGGLLANQQQKFYSKRDELFNSKKAFTSTYKLTLVKKDCTGESMTDRSTQKIIKTWSPSKGTEKGEWSLTWGGKPILKELDLSTVNSLADKNTRKTKKSCYKRCKKLPDYIRWKQWSYYKVQRG